MCPYDRIGNRLSDTYQDLTNDDGGDIPTLD